MQIIEGLFSHMVLQRNRAGVSQARTAGVCRVAGAVEAHVRLGGRTLPGWNWKRVGAARKRKFAARLDGLRTGGPYDIALRIRERGVTRAETSVRDVLVGDVWVLAGQSNMEGIGWLRDKLPPVNRVRAFYMTDEWDVAADPLHTLWCAVDPVHGGSPAAARHKKMQTHTGVGPGMAFGQSLLKATGVPQGLIACGHGGTSMDQWNSAKKTLGGRSLYGAMCRRVRRNGGAVAGVFWYQGCSDTAPETIAVYTPRMVRLVRAMRRDFRDPRLPVVLVQISRVSRAGDGTHWNAIREQQRRLPTLIPRLAVVPAIDLPLDDEIHISGAGQNRLGCRAAQAMRVLCEGKAAGLPPIDVRDVRLVTNPVSKLADIVVRFRNVAGRLTSPGLPAGFSLPNCDLRAHRTDLAGDSAILHTSFNHEVIAGGVSYGAGLDPYCNVTDLAGRALPAFGPLPIRTTKPRALTPFVTVLRVSPVLPGADIRTLRFPSRMDLEPRQFPGIFCDRHLELGPAGEALVYYAFDVRCAIPMTLRLLLGYDGPVKVWLDRREIFCDPKGTNPARPDDAAIPFSAKAGRHTVRVALSSHGAAWGLFLRLERTGIAAATLRRRLYSTLLPEILG